MYASAVTRIIAGRHGGRRLDTPRHDRTRPTTDRVREAVFSAITTFFGRASEPPDQALTGLSFLDLYAGSGAVGLEAASRGAAPVVLVEKDKPTAAIARANCTRLGVGAQVRTEAVAALLATPPTEPFRIVWMDPPYDTPTPTMGRVIEDLVGSSWLAPDPLVVVERSTRSTPFAWPTDLPVQWERRYGETTIYFAQEG